MSEISMQFKALKLYGMASCYTELRQQYTPDRMADLELADQILFNCSTPNQPSAIFVPSAIRPRPPDSRYNATYRDSTSVSPKSINN